MTWINARQAGHASMTAMARPNFARDFSKHLIWLGDFFEQ
jgi:hypothetical protein